MTGSTSVGRTSFDTDCWTQSWVAWDGGNEGWLFGVQHENHANGMRPIAYFDRASKAFASCTQRNAKAERLELAARYVVVASRPCDYFAQRRWFEFPVVAEDPDWRPHELVPEDYYVV